MRRAATRPRPTRSTPPRASAAAAPAPQASPPPQPSPVPASSPSRSSTPPFGRLLLTAFHSIGIDYLTLDHLRKAKKNALITHEYADLWRLLHDLVLVVLLDFDVDADAIRGSASSSAATQLDLLLHQELVRVHLYDWGFVCAAFYADETPAASVLLLALAWLLAYSRLFERQHDAILQLYVAKTASSIHLPCVRLPPYPNDVSLAASVVHDTVDAVVLDQEEILTRLSSSGSNTDTNAQLHQLQTIVGRISTHARALQSAVQAHSKLLLRVDEMQRKSGAVDDEELLPAYALQVFAQGKATLELHMRVISERLQMLEDEKLFYKWINSLLLQFAPPSSASAQQDSEAAADSDEAEDEGDDERKHREAALQTLAVECVDLYREMRLAQSKVEASSALCRQIAGLYAQEKQKWRQKPKTRTQQVKMDEKMDKLKIEIATNELWDVPTLLLESSGGSAGGRVSTTREQKKGEGAREREPPVREEELVQLQQQLERVLREITTEYCRVELK